MSKQRHDLGWKKRHWQRQHQKPKPGIKLEYERFKRNHPGPIPPKFRTFKDWYDNGQPKRWRRM